MIRTLTLTKHQGWDLLHRIDLLVFLRVLLTPISELTSSGSRVDGIIYLRMCMGSMSTSIPAMLRAILTLQAHEDR